MYTMGAGDWRAQPRFISPATAEHAAIRIARHAERWDLPGVDVVLHGGEPLLAGPDRLHRLFTVFQKHITPVTRLRLAMQTNGTLLDEAMIDVLAQFHARVSVSLDGIATAHDGRRLLPSGQGSHDRVASGLRQLISQAPASFAGLLATIDLSADPVATYEHLLSFSPPRMDFLLPYANWEMPPPGFSAGETPYADWLVRVFERWYSAPARETRVRILEGVIGLLLGGSSQVDSIGPGGARAVVVAVNGAISASDALAALVPAAAATGLDVAEDDFDPLLDRPVTRMLQGDRGLLSQACRSCPAVDVCGGGHPAYRYRHENGFDNPSVYCDDLFGLILHIRKRVAADVASLSRRPAA